MSDATPFRSPLSVEQWDDLHGDPLHIGVERDPTPWPDPEDTERQVSQPVIYVSGDAYLTPYDARQAADHLRFLADAVIQGEVSGA